MADDIAPPEPVETAPSIDIAAGVDQISADLFPESREKDPTPQETVAPALAEPTDAAPPTKTVPPLPTASPLPKSWKASMGDLWNKIPPEAQQYYEKREREMADGASQYKDFAEYGKTLQAAMAPYQPTLQAQGIDAPTAVRTLLEAHYKLTSGTLESRQAAYRDLGTRLGIPGSATNTTESTPIDPRIQTLEQKLDQMHQVLTQQQQAALQAAQQKASVEVGAFAADPTHAFFDECHEDIVKFLKAGDSLQEAYDKAVWANPVTREKNKQSWFQTETEKQKERARLDALPKQKARGVNVNGRDTQRTPTDPLGSMEETLRSTFRTIKEKTVH
jgi:hypothetical protein